MSIIRSRLRLPPGSAGADGDSREARRISDLHVSGISSHDKNAENCWKGKVAMDPEEFFWFGAMEIYLGEENAKRLMIGLARRYDLYFWGYQDR